MICPQCDQDTLARGVIFADSPAASDMVYCFSCAVRYTARELASCVDCSRPWPTEANVEGSIAGMCPDCRNHLDLEGDA